MATTNQKLTRFRGAMEAVYGVFSHVSAQDIPNWSVPAQPGNAGHRGRYLWTDAFGVVNFISLFHETKEPRYLELAKRLTETVHDVLGRTRDGQSRLPGATEERPLDGGLRIGKVDEAGPDGDGQYHHYLTLWMFALNRLSLASKDVKYNELGIQLAKAIHPRFVVQRGGEDSMVWKISTDMRQTLVRSKGHLDDVTGLAVFQMLQSTAGNASLEAEIEQYRSIMASSGPLHSSSDMLDLGMSLWIAHFYSDAEWSRELADDGLKHARYQLLRNKSRLLEGNPQRRLAFREFGACLGVECYDKHPDVEASADELVKFWENAMNETTPPDLMPITQVMYAAALIPGGLSRRLEKLPEVLKLTHTAFRNGYLDRNG